MATGAKNGAYPIRKLGSASDNLGLQEYDIADGYASSIYKGDFVKQTTDGTIVLATNGADALGVFLGCSYTKADGTPTEAPYWPASTSSATQPKAKIGGADPDRIFQVKGNGPIPLVVSGDIFAMENIGSGSTLTGQSSSQAAVLTVINGDVDLTGETDIGANVAGVADNDAFSIKTSQAASATTITVEDGDGITELLSKLNAVDNISAELDSNGYLQITATDGYDLVIAEVTNTPYAALFAGSAGTFTEVVAAGAGLVKVVNVIDSDNYLMAVTLVNQENRDDG